MNKLLVQGLALAALVGITGPALAQVPSAPYDEPYTFEHDVQAASAGELDLTLLPVTYPPSRLRLNLTNSSSNHMAVSIDDLETTFMVPANSSRTFDYSTLQVGNSPDSMAYDVQVLEGSNYAISYHTDISHILAPGYAARYVPAPDEEPVRRGGSVRGYW